MKYTITNSELQTHTPMLDNWVGTIWKWKSTPYKIKIIYLQKVK